MDDFPLSDDSAAAVTALASAIDRIAPSAFARDALVVAVRDLIDARIADAVEVLADRLENATGIRP